MQSCKSNASHASSLEFLGLDKRNFAFNLGLEGLGEEKTKLSSNLPAVDLFCGICCVGTNHVVEGIAGISNFLVSIGNRKREVILDFIKEETVTKSEYPVSEA